MKKILKLFIILIIFIPFVNVKAYFYANVTAGANLPNNTYWFANFGQVGSIVQYTKKNSGSDGIYHYPTRKYTGEIGGSTYDMVCIDPGVQEADGLYTCEEYNNPAIKKLFDNKSKYDEKVFITAVRFLAADDGRTLDDKHNSMKFYRQSGIGIFGEGNTYNGPGTEGNVRRSLSETGLIKEAKKLADSVAGTTSSTPVEGEATFTITNVTNNNTDVTVTFTSDRNMKLTPDITCTSGCVESTTVVSWAAGSNTGSVTFRVKTPSPCKAFLKIDYVPMGTDTTNLYLCYAGGGPGGPTLSREQKMVTSVPPEALTKSSGMIGGDKVTTDTVGKKTKSNIEVPLSESFKKTFCKPDEDCDCSTPSDVTIDITFCCTDETTSEVKEPKINELFCTKKKKCGTDEDIIVKGAYDINASNFDTPYEVPDGGSYCRVYCTERIKVEIPSGIEGVNGKYFDLNSVGINKPEISGMYTCRNIIDYDKWLNDYVSASKVAVTAYNSYQKEKAIHDATKDEYDSAKEGNETYKVTFKYTGKTGAYDASNQYRECEYNVDGSCDAPFSFKKKVASKKVNYIEAKIEYKNGKSTATKFEKFEVKSQNASTSTTAGYYDITFTGDSSKSNCPSSTATESYGTCAPTTWCNDAACTDVVSTHSLNVTGSIGNYDESKKPKDLKDDITYKNQLNGSLVNDADFTKAVGDIETKWKQIKKCDDYFDKNSSDFLKDKFQVPQVKFQWFYTYLNSNSYVREKDTIYTYTENSGCWPKGTGEVKTDDAETGVQAPHYDENNTVQNGTYITFANKKIKCNNDNKNCGNGAKDSNLTDLLRSTKEETVAQQKYTSDSKFEYDCKYSPPPESTKYTVYPYGGFVGERLSTNKRAYTEHNGKIYVEYSTLNGDYQTQWIFNGLGSKISAGVGKFDKYFKNGKDCTGNVNSGVDSSMLFCTFNVKRSLTKIRGCKTIASLFSSSSFWAKVCCDRPDCSTTNDDTLSFAFKIVDPSDLFPGTSGYTSSSWPESYTASGSKGNYAYNWYWTDKGLKNLEKIETHSGNEKEYSKDRITYQFHLNAKAITTIKEYNSRINNYNALFQGDYTKGTPNGPATEYHSEFIENFYKNKIQLYKFDINGNASPEGTAVQLKTKVSGSLSLARDRVHWDGNDSKQESTP